MPDPPLLSLRGVSKSFGGIHAVHDISFDMRAGESVGLPDDKARLLANSGSAKILGPIQAGSLGGKVSLAPGIVGFVNVLVIRQAAMSLCNGVLKLKNAGCTGVRLGETGKLENG